MKPSKSSQIRIVNPVAGEAVFTSVRSARNLVDRGRFEYVRGGNAIRRLEDVEIRQARQAQKDRLDDEAVWAEVAHRRLGVTPDRMVFKMVRSANRPTMPGGPEGAAITAFIPVIEHS